MRCRAIVLFLLALPLLAAAGDYKKVCSGKGMEGWTMYGEPFKVYRAPDPRANSNGLKCRKACIKDRRCFSWEIESHPRTPNVCNFYTGGANSEYYVGNTATTFRLFDVCLNVPTSMLG